MFRFFVALALALSCLGGPVALADEVDRVVEEPPVEAVETVDALPADDHALGGLLAQDEGEYHVERPLGEDGPILYVTNHDPDPLLANLEVQITPSFADSALEGRWGHYAPWDGWHIDEFDPTRRNQIVCIGDPGTWDTDSVGKLKFRWGGLPDGGGRIDIYEYLTDPYPVSERYTDEHGNVVVDYYRYYQEAFTHHGADLDGEILAIYTFRHEYRMIVEPGARTDLSAATVTLEPGQFVYGEGYTVGSNHFSAGGGFFPKLAVTLGDKVLTPGVDYALPLYFDCQNAGTATAMIKGMGGYVGTKSVEYQIDKAANGMEAHAARASIAMTYAPSSAAATGPNVVVSGAAGEVAYANASTDAAAMGFSVDAATGEVTVPAATPAGTYEVKVAVSAAGDANHEPGSQTVTYEIVVGKAANGMRVRRTTRKVAAARVARKKRVVRPLRVTGASGRVRYRRLSKGSSKRLSVNRRTGRVTVRKGTKPGTYTVRIRVAAAGDANHRAAAKTVTCKVVVK
ncbi:MAG: hypothetical protein IKG22_07105 [Atopobiaceae bacterium]|nr:hypothetical protein [Atopobiaceae bacterium]